jgi:hypothetical protein
MANTTLIQKRSVLAVKVEGSYGSDSTPAAADAMIVENLQLPDPQIQLGENPAMTGSLNAERAPSITGYYQTATFDFPLKHSGAGATTAPKLGRILKDAGMAEDTTGDVTYTSSNAFKGGYTYSFYTDGKLHKIVGGVADIKSLSFVAPGIAKATVEVTGLYVAPSDVVVLATPTFDASAPIPFVSATFTVGGFAAIIRSVEFVQNNVIGERPNASAASGYAGFIITKRGWEGTLVCEDDLVANRPWVANLIAGAAKALTFNIGTSTNKLTVTAGAIVKTSLTHSEENGVALVNIGFKCLPTTVDGVNEIDLSFS